MSGLVDKRTMDSKNNAIEKAAAEAKILQRLKEIDERLAELDAIEEAKR